MRIRAKVLVGCLMLIVAVSWWAPVALNAQSEAETPAEEQAQQAEPDQAEPGEEAAEGQPAGESEPIPVDLDATPSRFIPSEEVSEDLSVPFPIDI